LTFLAAVATLLTEVVPWVRAVTRDFSVVRADWSPLIWELNWPWASRRTSFASAVMALMSAVTVRAVVSDGVRCAKLVPVAHSAATSAHSAEDGDPLPAAAGADADAVTVGDAVAVDTADPLADAPGGLEEELQAATASTMGTAASPAAHERMRLDGDDISLLRAGIGPRLGPGMVPGFPVGHPLFSSGAIYFVLRYFGYRAAAAVPVVVRASWSRPGDFNRATM
jgi:hypothetical protein